MPDISRVMKTATDIIVSTTTIYPDSNGITVAIKGNGIDGVGEQTPNIFDKFNIRKTTGATTIIQVPDGFIIELNKSGYGIYIVINVTPNTQYYFKFKKEILSGSDRTSVAGYTGIDQFGTMLFNLKRDNTEVTFNTGENTVINIHMYVTKGQAGAAKFYEIMLNSGNDYLNYEPYGYKAPIILNSNTIPVYIGDNPLRKSLDGTAVDELAADGTLTRRVDSDGSVLATPVVTQITMPTFTTTVGANTVSVDTTVQPSETAITYHGWHSGEFSKRLNEAWVDSDYSVFSDYTIAKMQTLSIAQLQTHSIRRLQGGWV